MGCSTPGFPVLHCLPEFAQTHVHWVGDAIQPSHSLLPSSPSLSLSWHQEWVGFFQWIDSSGGQSIAVPASVLPMNIQSWFSLGLTSLISLQFKGLSKVYSRTTIWKYQLPVYAVINIDSLSLQGADKCMANLVICANTLNLSWVPECGKLEKCCLPWLPRADPDICAVCGSEQSMFPALAEQLTELCLHHSSCSTDAMLCNLSIRQKMNSILCIFTNNVIFSSLFLEVCPSPPTLLVNVREFE